MNKQEKIQEAYGENYNKCNPDENGWSKYRLDDDRNLIEGFNINSILKCEFDNFRQDNVKRIYCVRPIILKGIENNNGWIKIESEYDLPEQTGSYYVVRCEKVEIAVYIKDNRWLAKGNDYPKTTIHHSITHYQPIEKPKPPLF